MIATVFVMEPRRTVSPVVRSDGTRPRKAINCCGVAKRRTRSAGYEDIFDHFTAHSPTIANVETWPNQYALAGHL
jgi:hypothetical protein